MRFFVLCLFIVTTVLSSFAQKNTRPPRTSEGNSQQAEQQLADDKEAIQKLHDEDIQASLALDVPKLESLWTNDIVMLAPGGPPILGREANAKRLEDDAAKLKSVEIMAYDEQWQEVRIEGDWAYEWGSIAGRTRPFTGGKESEYKWNVLRVLNRQPDGSWKIARSIYNDASPAPERPAEQPKPEEQKKDRMKD
jgi:ketosteroid isomerase-like protein